jgi:hypothetical protein
MLDVRVESRFQELGHTYFTMNCMCQMVKSGQTEELLTFNGHHNFVELY